MSPSKSTSRSPSPPGEASNANPQDVSKTEPPKEEALQADEVGPNPGLCKDQEALKVDAGGISAAPPSSPLAGPANSRHQMDIEIIKEKIASKLSAKRSISPADLDIDQAFIHSMMKRSKLERMR